MSYLNLEYDDPILVQEFVRNDKKHRLFFVKTKDKSTGLDHYFFKLYTWDFQKRFYCEGYIYFYIDFFQKESTYIGTFIHKNNRNQGLASLLTSYWISFCFDFGLINLKTNLKQRKPFLLYILKKYSFELNNIELYTDSPFTISILKPDDFIEKSLYFKNKAQQETFTKGRIMANDHYKIYDSLDGKVVLDNVLLSNTYELKDETTAYKRVRKSLNGDSRF